MESATDKAKLDQTLAELRIWHELNAAECRREGEEDERAFHLEAAHAISEAHKRMR